MSKYSIANRYAIAFYADSEEKNILSEVSADMELIYDSLESSAELRKILLNPIIDKEKKIEIVLEIFSDRIVNETKDFIKFLFYKKRENLTLDIVKQFLVIRDDKEGILNALITTAEEINEGQRSEFINKLELYSAKKVRAKFLIDKKIIGGFLIKIDDKVIDASILQNLKNLKTRLLQEEILYN